MGIKQRNVDENGDGGSNGPLGGGKDQTAQKSRMGITRTTGWEAWGIYMVGYYLRLLSKKKR